MSRVYLRTPRYKTSFPQREMYNSYKQNRKKKAKIIRDDFFRLIATFNREVMKLILYKNLLFKIPYGLGVMQIIKIKKTNIVLDDKGNIIENDLVINRVATWKLWDKDPKAKAEHKYVYHLNEHTDGYVYKFRWNKYRAAVNNITSYKFNPTRSNKQWLNNILMDKDLEVDFFELKTKKNV